jgi:hypothetical protein
MFEKSSHLARRGEDVCCLLALWAARKSDCKKKETLVSLCKFGMWPICSKTHLGAAG